MRIFQSARNSAQLTRQFCLSCQRRCQNGQCSTCQGKLTQNGHSVVEEGLNLGDTVVIDGVDKLREGSKVNSLAYKNAFKSLYTKAFTKIDPSRIFIF